MWRATFPRENKESLRNFPRAPVSPALQVSVLQAILISCKSRKQSRRLRKTEICYADDCVTKGSESLVIEDLLASTFKAPSLMYSPTEETTRGTFPRRYIERLRRVGVEGELRHIEAFSVLRISSDKEASSYSHIRTYHYFERT